MSFKIIFTSDGDFHALDEVRAVMPQSVFPCFKAGLLRLAEDPVGLGERAYYPHLDEEGVKDAFTLFYTFHCDSGGRRYWFRPYFHFDEDEASIVVDNVQVTVFPLPGATE